ncbi:MAG: hypothetical protein ACYCXY_06355 [Acidimicrobiales bacterium]
MRNSTPRSVSLRACFGGYRWPRSLPETAVAGLGVMERAGLGLGSTSVASLLLLGTGATQADLPPAAFGCEPGDTGASDAAEQYLDEWHEEQHAFLVGELLDNGPGNGDPDSDTDEDLVLHRIGLLGPVLSHRPARRAELEALLRSCAACRKPAGATDDTDEVVLARDKRLCLDVLLAHLLRRITAAGAVLGDHDIAVLSRLVCAAAGEVLDAM